MTSGIARIDTKEPWHDALDDGAGGHSKWGQSRWRTNYSRDRGTRARLSAQRTVDLFPICTAQETVSQVGNSVEGH